jgi:UTP--glucose-1-phosphate uridylyltransferase
VRSYSQGTRAIARRSAYSIAAVPITDAIIPVAGLGTRLLPATRSQPKEMLPIVDKPVVQYVVEEVVAAGIQRVLFVTGRRKRAIEDHFDADPELDTGPLIDPRTGLQVLYTRQARPAGLGDAIRYGAGLSDRAASVVALGDSIIESPRHVGRGIVRRLIGAFDAGGVDAAVAVEEVSAEDVSRYGIVVAADDEAEVIEVSDVIEKPEPTRVDSRLAVAGRYAFGPNVFAALRDTAPDSCGEVQVADALRAVIADGGRVVALRLSDGERRHDVGTIESYCEAFISYALGHPRLGPTLREHARALLDG